MKIMDKLTRWEKYKPGGQNWGMETTLKGSSFSFYNWVFHVQCQVFYKMLCSLATGLDRKKAKMKAALEVSCLKLETKVSVYWDSDCRTPHDNMQSSALSKFIIHLKKHNIWFLQTYFSSESRASDCCGCCCCCCSEGVKSESSFTTFHSKCWCSKHYLSVTVQEEKLIIGYITSRRKLLIITRTDVCDGLIGSSGASCELEQVAVILGKSMREHVAPRCRQQVYLLQGVHFELIELSFVCLNLSLHLK